MQPVRTPDGRYSLPIATLHSCCSQRLWLSGSHPFRQSHGARFNLPQTTRLHRWRRGWLIHLLHLSSPSSPPKRWDCQNCSRVRVLLLSWISQVSPTPRSLSKKSSAEGRKGERERGRREEVSATNWPSPVLIPLLKTQLGDCHHPVPSSRGR